MTNQTNHNALQLTARIAGIAYLIIIAAGIYAEFGVRGALIVPDDAAATAANIMASEGVFRSGIASDLLMVMSDVVIGVLFYLLLKPVNHTLALIAAFFRLGQAATLGINLLNMLVALQLLSGAEYLSAFSADQLYAQVMVSLDAHATGYRISLVFFAVSILILGYLMVKSRFFPRILGVLLVIGAFGYLIDSFADFLMPNYAAYANIIELALMPAVIAEVSLCLWLLVRGVNTQAVEATRSLNTVSAKA